MNPERPGWSRVQTLGGGGKAADVVSAGGGSCALPARAGRKWGALPDERARPARQSNSDADTVAGAAGSISVSAGEWPARV